MSRMWINKKNKKENVNKVSCWILAVIFAVVVFGRGEQRDSGS